MDNLSSLKAETTDKANKARAKKLLGDEGRATPLRESKSSGSKEKMGPYKKGGLVKNCK